MVISTEDYLNDIFQNRSNQVYKKLMTSLRINYLHMRYTYYFNSLKSKINKTLFRKS